MCKNWWNYSRNAQWWHFAWKRADVNNSNRAENYDKYEMHDHGPLTGLSLCTNMAHPGSLWKDIKVKTMKCW